MNWNQPPNIKIFEALGAVADGRVHLVDDTAEVYSSSGKKYYSVSYDAASHIIASNDNGSYWQGYLGYPAIAFLLCAGKLSYDEKVAAGLAGILWKDLNSRLNNDYEATERYARERLYFAGLSKSAVDTEVTGLADQIKRMCLKRPDGQQLEPPEGY